MPQGREVESVAGVSKSRMKVGGVIPIKSPDIRDP